jgi:hypothetical protein
MHGLMMAATLSKEAAQQRATSKAAASDLDADFGHVTVRLREQPGVNHRLGRWAIMDIVGNSQEFNTIHI